jgi:hypothetical protein
MIASLIARPRSVALLVALTLNAVATRGAANEVDVCVQAVDRAQRSRYDGKLRAARDDLVICARDACPKPIRRDCAQWLGEVEEKLPSVVFRVSVNAEDAHDVKILVDGEPLAGAGEGRAVALDPGEHSLTVEAADAVPLTTRRVVREGEKSRVIAIGLSPERRQVEVTKGAAPPTRSIPASAFVATSVAALGFAGFAYLGLSGTHDLDHLRETCKPNCAPSDVTAAREKLLVGDIALGIGVLAAGIAVWLVLTRPSRPGAAPRASSHGVFEARF